MIETIELGSIAQITKLAGYEFTKYIDYIEDGEIIAIRALNIKNGQLDLTDIKRVSKEVSDSLTRSKLFKDDIILSYTGSKYGDVTIMPENDKYHLAPNVAKVTVNENENPYFYYLLMTSSEFQWYLKNYGVGTGQPTIPMKNIRRIPVSHPSLEVQNKIVDIIKPINEKIVQNQEINHHLLEQAISIHKEYCISKADSSFTNETIKSLSNDVITGKTPSTKIKEYYGGELPFITIPDMHGKVYCVETARYLTPLGEKSQANKTLPANSIAVSCIATPGLVSFLDRASQTNQQINTVLPQENQEYYMYLELLSKSQLIDELGSSGSTTHNLNKGQFEKITIIAPPVESRIKLNNLLKPLFEKIRLNQREIIRLQQIRDILLPKLMSGEISVID